MSPEERELLNKSVSLAEDNNKMLHSIRGSIRRGNVVRAIYWIFIIGSAVGAFYFIQPYFDDLKNMYNDTVSQLKNFGH